MPKVLVEVMPKVMPKVMPELVPPISVRFCGTFLKSAVLAPHSRQRLRNGRCTCPAIGQIVVIAIHGLQFLKTHIIRRIIHVLLIARVKSRTLIVDTILRRMNARYNTTTTDLVDGST